MDFSTREDYKKVWDQYTGIFVEIGVWKGEFSEFVVSNCKFTKVYGVDPYKKFAMAEYNDTNNIISQDEYDDIYINAVKCFNKYDNYKLIRTTSHLASTAFEDNTIDVVYVDGNHQYSSVLEDLELWWNKIKIGGMIAGDDMADDLDKPYENNNQKITWYDHCWGYYGVNLALDTFKKRYPVKVQRLPNYQWIIIKIE